MKKILLIIVAVAGCVVANAQDFDLAAIAQKLAVKADSASMIMGQLNGTQAAVNHPTTEARQQLLKSFNDALGVTSKGEQYKEGNSFATEFFKVAQDMKKRTGIVMNRKSYAQAVLNRFNDTTITMNMQQEVTEINKQARALIEELTALHKDSANLAGNAQLIALKSDSLSQNMGHFFGMQMNAMSKQKKLTAEQCALLLEGFNNAINIDESNKPLVDGNVLANDFMSIQQNIKKQLNLNLNKDTYVAALTRVLNDPKVPTEEDVKALNAKVQAYMKQTQTFARENSPEALTQKGLGMKYIEKLLTTDSGYVKAPSGLVYKVLAKGSGKQFGESDRIKVMYKGTHVDGKTFDESKQPVTFAPSQVVPGFREALMMMRPGAKMIAVLPQELAYGARGAGQSIKPFETLVFEIETIGLDDAAASKDKPAKATTQTTQTKQPQTTKATKATKNTKATKATSKRKTTKRRK